jgi:hypothetical protein
MSTGSNRGYDGVPEMETDQVEHRRKMARKINGLNQGKFNATIDVTLRASQTTTTLTDPRIAATSGIVFMPQTAHAAAALASLYVSARQKGQATLTHASSANTDQTFTALIIG